VLVFYPANHQGFSTACQQASINENAEYDSTGATSPGTMNLNNARDGQEMSNMNDIGPVASSIPMVTVDPSPIMPRSSSVANTDSGFGHATTEELFTTSGPALTNLSELSQYQDLSSIFTLDENFPSDA
jgi:hypothetical protein